MANVQQEIREADMVFALAVLVDADSSCRYGAPPRVLRPGRPEEIVLTLGAYVPFVIPLL